ncbi:MAG: AMMECR1 domain-containing protein [Betaproteobacteria bacterium RIFCSPLOWO2_02_FULL_67_26]|nr:MAG: AMMECR1 domain-containing protein [Betaproteobacteria bacterium RIFCSPLOWO2_02_FULL_67_26]
MQSGNPVPFPRDAGQVLLPLARAAIAAELGLGGAASEDQPWLRQQGACFITLMRDEKLRGCIGTLRPHRPLADDVKANAVAAAFRDPRFTPLTAEDFAAVAVEISVLSVLQPMSFSDEPDALRQLRAGVDGLVFEYGHHTSTFLPQVWEDLKEPTDFLAHLKYKAGLPPDFWDKEVRLSRYTVFKWRE